MIKKLFIMAAGIALATGLAACSHGKKGKTVAVHTTEAQQKAAAQDGATVIVAEDSKPAAAFTKGEY